MTRRLTAFLAGRVCEAFMTGESFASLDSRFKLPKGTAERIYRRWDERIDKRRRRR